MRKLQMTIVTLLFAVPMMSAPVPGSFELIATYHVSGEVAEIAAATPDGKTVVYTDSEEEEIGFVSLVNPAVPVEIGTLEVDGEPTSVAITGDGRFALVAVNAENSYLAVVSMKSRQVVREIPLFGQPDSVAISPDGRFAAVAIENERQDEDEPMPQAPAGFLTIVNLVGPVSAWSTRDVSLSGIADRFPTDPEPEFVTINQRNIAAVTLQENNHVVLVNLVDGTIVDDWSVGSTSHLADLQDNGIISFTDMLVNARREPDAIAWTRGGNLVTANEGDYDLDLADGEFVGGRDFTIFSAEGDVLFEPGSSLEEAAAALGLYPDSRSDAKGVEPEGVAVGKYRGSDLLFVGAERGNFVAVYSLRDETRPELLQILPTGRRPEGLVTIENRGLFLTSNEGNGTLSIFQYVK